MALPLTVAQLLDLLEGASDPGLVVYFEPAGNDGARVPIRSAYVSSRDVEPPNHPDGSPNYECGEFIFAVSDEA
jgi:hypothetical protein